MSEQKKDVFLPRNVVPVNYVLKLEPDLVKCTFVGTVDIEVVLFVIIASCG